MVCTATTLKDQKIFKQQVKQPGMQTIINCHYFSFSRAQIQQVKLIKFLSSQ